MKPTELVQEFFSKVYSVVNQIKSLGEELTDQKVVEKVLRSLPPKFDHVVATIEESKVLSTYSLNELMGSLQAHEERINRTVETPIQQAFQSKLDLKKKSDESSQWNSNRGRGRSSRGRGRGKGKGRSNGQQRFFNGGNNSYSCSYCGRSNHEDKDCWFKEKHGQNRNAPQCYYCKQYGHIEKNYFKKAAENSNSHEDKDIAEESLFLSCLFTHDDKPEDVWYLYSGFSNHMTGSKHFFVEIDKSIKTQVRMGNNNQVQACGMGTIVVMTEFGKTFLHDVMYVPGLAHNLISIG